MNASTAAGIVCYLVALTVVLLELFALGNPKYRWAVRFDHWCYGNVPTWLANVHGWAINIAIAIATAPIWIGLSRLLGWLSRIAWIADLPIVVQVLVPPFIVLCVLVEARGVISRLDVTRRVIVFVILFMTFAALEADHPKQPIWMDSFWFGILWGGIGGLASGGLIYGRKLGFWATFRRLFDMKMRLYGPGFPLGDHPRKWHGWHLTMAQEDEAEKSDIFGDARVASIEEMKKGGLL
jgi:hypothetical protein